MPFAVRLPFPAAATVAVAAVVVLRLATSFVRRSLSASADRRQTLLVLSAKTQEEKRSLVSGATDGTLALSFSPEAGDAADLTVVEDSNCPSLPPASFSVQRYLDGLDTRLLGRTVLHSPRMSSTHDLVSQNFEKLPVGTVCVSDQQFKGRGRSKNKWESPPGCLMFSFTMQMEDGRKLPLLQYVVCLAITEAIARLCRDRGMPQLNVRIKWPNDLYLNGLKVGGILCTSTYRSKLFNVCAGIGLNVDNEKPTTCLNAEFNQVDERLQKLTREDIMAFFFNKFEELLEVFLNQGFQTLEEQYYNAWLHSGQKVVIEEVFEGQSVETPVIVQGLTPTGYLLAIDDESNRYELHPDGNSLDFFKGLVRKKIE